MIDFVYFIWPLILCLILQVQRGTFANVIFILYKYIQKIDIVFETF